MEKHTITEIDIETQQVIIREMTEEEYAQKQLDIETHTSLQDEITTKAETRAALLERLGITEEEAQLLLGGN